MNSCFTVIPENSGINEIFDIIILVSKGNRNHSYFPALTFRSAVAW
jgi:hypothetical protein